jgi:hypothetical protein
LILCL